MLRSYCWSQGRSYIYMRQKLSSQFITCTRLFDQRRCKNRIFTKQYNLLTLFQWKKLLKINWRCVTVLQRNRFLHNTDNGKRCTQVKSQKNDESSQVRSKCNWCTWQAVRLDCLQPAQNNGYKVHVVYTHNWASLNQNLTALNVNR